MEDKAPLSPSSEQGEPAGLLKREGPSVRKNLAPLQNTRRNLATQKSLEGKKRMSWDLSWIWFGALMLLLAEAPLLLRPEQQQKLPCLEEQPPTAADYVPLQLEGPPPEALVAAQPPEGPPEAAAAALGEQPLLPGGDDEAEQDIFQPELQAEPEEVAEEPPEPPIVVHPPPSPEIPPVPVVPPVPAAVPPEAPPPVEAPAPPAAAASPSPEPHAMPDWDPQVVAVSEGFSPEEVTAEGQMTVIECAFVESAEFFEKLWDSTPERVKFAFVRHFLPTVPGVTVPHPPQSALPVQQQQPEGLGVPEPQQEEESEVSETAEEESESPPTQQDEESSSQPVDIEGTTHGHAVTPLEAGDTEEAVPFVPNLEEAAELFRYPVAILSQISQNGVPEGEADLHSLRMLLTSSVLSAAGRRLIALKQLYEFCQQTEARCHVLGIEGTALPSVEHLVAQRDALVSVAQFLGVLGIGEESSPQAAADEEAEGLETTEAPPSAPENILGIPRILAQRLLDAMEMEALEVDGSNNAAAPYSVFWEVVGPPYPHEEERTLTMGAPMKDFPIDTFYNLLKGFKERQKKTSAEDVRTWTQNWTVQKVLQILQQKDAEAGLNLINSRRLKEELTGIYSPDHPDLFSLYTHLL